MISYKNAQLQILLSGSIIRTDADVGTRADMFQTEHAGLRSIIGVRIRADG